MKTFAQTNKKHPVRFFCSATLKPLVSAVASMALTLNALSTHANEIAVKVEQPTSDATANVEITTRLGKFGPMATITMPKFRLGAREEKIVGHTDTGVPVTERKHNVIEAGRAIASEGKLITKSASKQAKSNPSPKLKHKPRNGKKKTLEFWLAKRWKVVQRQSDSLCQG